METASNISSEDELLQLRDDGKVSEAEYAELLEALNKPESEKTQSLTVAEPQFEAFRVRVMTGSLVLCLIGLPVGLILKLPFVWGLSILGLIIGPIKLSRIESSWLAKLMKRYKR